MADKSKNRGASPNSNNSSSAPTVAEDTSLCEVSGGPIGGDGIGSGVVEDMVEYFEPSPVAAHFVDPDEKEHECPGCVMEGRAKKLVLGARQIEVLMNLSAKMPGTLSVETRQVLGELRMLGLVDRVYCAGYTDHRGWQLLEAGEAMMCRITVANKAISRRAVPSVDEVRSFMASRAETGIPELDEVLKGGLPRDKIVQVRGRAEVPEPEEEK